MSLRLITLIKTNGRTTRAIGIPHLKNKARSGKSIGVVDTRHKDFHSPKNGAAACLLAANPAENPICSTRLVP